MDLKKIIQEHHVIEGAMVDFNDVSLESLGGHLFFGDVDAESVKHAATFILKSNQLLDRNEITLFINSFGGECGSAFALIDIMEISKLKIRTVGLGNVMSMGLLILSAGSVGKRILTKNTNVMAHQFSGAAEGKFHELLADHHGNQLLKHRFIEHFKRHSKLKPEQIEDILFSKSDRFLTPAECKKFGLIDSIVDELPDFSSIKKRSGSRKS